MKNSKDKIGYVDGFVLTVPKKNVAAYKKMAQEVGKIWVKCGALGYTECMGEDLSSNMGNVTGLTFPQISEAKKEETVWFSYVTFKSRKHRDEVNKKIHLEMQKKYKNKKMKTPFDMKRIAYGGFKVEVNI